MQFNFDNSYLRLHNVLYKKSSLTKFPNAQLLLFNDNLAKDLDLCDQDLNAQDKRKLVTYFSGTEQLPGACYIAQAYAGHQFGFFNRLGDGRAILLGEQLTVEGQRYDIQLKGSGRTIYSRRGDGRATLYSMLREYLISEAMHALGIPSSRSLAVIATGDKIQREYLREGGVLARVASSHIRVGTFQYAAKFLGVGSLRGLLNYAIQRHYPSLIAIQDEEEKALAFFKAVAAKQMDTVVHWLRVGFIHGVMNTDNISISGETIDYGPCAFMNIYDDQTTYSSIDHQSRYAFGQQKHMLLWGLARFYESLLPLFSNVEKAVEEAKAVFDQLTSDFAQKERVMYGQKLGLSHPEDFTEEDLSRVLSEMKRVGMDYTNFFLMVNGILTRSLTNDQMKFVDEVKKLVLDYNTNSTSAELKRAKDLAKQVNPCVVPRNQIVEKALMEGEKGEPEYFQKCQDVFSRPYSLPNEEQFLKGDERFEEMYQTFCGT